MNVLHICSDYPYTPLYQQLLLHFNDNTIKHTMYVPLMKGRPANDKYDINSNNAQVIYSYDYTNCERIRYHHKLNNILWKLRNKINLNDTNLVHAHYLFSSGGVAYEIKQKSDIDYIVAIRNTDINTFFKYAIHLRKFGIEILNAAKT